MAIKSLDLAGLMLYDGKIKQYIATLAGNTASSAISTHNSDINAHSTLLAGYVKTSRQIAGKALTSDITSAELTAALNEATTSLKGLMSAMDKTRLDNLWAVFDNGENENFVDTLTEILEIFQNYPEGADIMAKLNQKVDKVDGKGLSTNDYTDADKSKVDSIDARDAAILQEAKDYADDRISEEITAEKVKQLYEANPDTNAFTDEEKAKLAGIEEGAQVNTVSPEDLVADNISFDGSGTNFLEGETDVKGAIKRLDVKMMNSEEFFSFRIFELQGRVEVVEDRIEAIEDGTTVVNLVIEIDDDVEVT